MRIAGRRFLLFALSGVVCFGCDRLWETSLGPGEDLARTLSTFETATRMVIKAGDVVARETTERSQVIEVSDFFKKYPRGWLLLSGAGGDYDVFLYRQDDLIGRLGITATSRVKPGEDTLNVGDRFRRVPAAEVSALMDRLKLPWPIVRR